MELTVGEGLEEPRSHPNFPLSLSLSLQLPLATVSSAAKPAGSRRSVVERRDAPPELARHALATNGWFGKIWPIFSFWGQTVQKKVNKKNKNKNKILQLWKLYELGGMMGTVMTQHSSPLPATLSLYGNTENNK